MRTLVAVIALACGGCIESQLLACPGDDLLCARGDVCDAVHHLCITPEQATACVGVADGTPCTATLDGICLDQVCLHPQCGDRVIEPGEVCDDGNREDGDGCNATCTSIEACGNGVVDVIGGEACDDGNRIDGDGCDSLCRVEQDAWSVEGIAPHPLAGRPGRAVYDPVHRQFIQVADGALWTWDGARWSLLSLDGPVSSALYSYQLVFDSDRKTVVFLGSTTLALDHIWEWDGTTWTQTATVGGPAVVEGPLATYDRVAHRILVVDSGFGTPRLWSLDVATATWTQLAAPPSLSPYDFGVAFDEMRNVTVVAVGDTTPSPVTRVLEWNGSAWTTITAPMPAAYNWTIVYDPMAAAVIAVGGNNSGVAPPVTTIAAWTGASWVTRPEALPDGRDHPEVVVDTQRGRRVVLWGNDSNGSLFYDIHEWDGAQWTGALRAPPTSGAAYAYDARLRELVSFGGAPGVITNETWIHDTAWRQIPSGATPVLYQGAIAFDPNRGGVVMTTTNQGTWLLRDEQWTAFEAPGGGAGVGVKAMSFDATRGSLIASDGFTTFELPSTASHWMTLGNAPANSPSLAFDARNAQTVLVDAMSGSVFRLAGTSWNRLLSPGPGYHVVADARRGTVVLETANDVLYERDQATWIELPQLPRHVDGPALYMPDTGELVVIGSIGYNAVMLRHRFVGVSPIESCAPGDDLDGDGLVACADPDCWWQCTPACPPYASCP